MREVDEAGGGGGGSGNSRIPISQVKGYGQNKKT